ncbi:MAG: 2,3-cyclic 3-phosphodiesterase [Solirubrobacteraceae bacterium]|nr:2,3-cyclic 3-phosphodiesterase [Solirubrobacteraceae bacterium]
MSARLFAALDVPAPVRETLAAFGGDAAAGDFALRPVRDDALHVTLAFLGHRPLDDIEPARAAVRAAAAPVPELELGKALWLSPRRPHVLTVEVLDPTGALARLQESVSAALAEAIGYEPERRRFLAHITVARVRRGAVPRHGDLPEAPSARFAGEAVTLYRSFLGGGPVRYEPLERVTL